MIWQHLNVRDEMHIYYRNRITAGVIIGSLLSIGATIGGGPLLGIFSICALPYLIQGVLINKLTKDMEATSTLMTEAEKRLLPEDMRPYAGQTREERKRELLGIRTWDNDLTSSLLVYMIGPAVVGILAGLIWGKITTTTHIQEDLWDRYCRRHWSTIVEYEQCRDSPLAAPWVHHLFDVNLDKDSHLEKNRK